jgi:8-oxo-dGTP diphosphatase
MSETITFGSRLEGVHYTERPAAYAVVVGENGTVAAVKGKSGLFWLPGGGSWPHENAEETVVREVREELGRNIRLIRKIGEATKYFYAASDDRHYEMVAVFFVAEFRDEPSGQGEYELYWLPLKEAEGAFFHESHAWAVHQA